MNTNKPFRVRVLHNIYVQDLEAKINSLLSELEDNGFKIVACDIIKDNLAYTIVVKFAWLV